MTEIIERIASLRKKKGISHEAMAANLNITQAAYSKLEKGDTKLSVERLYQIAEILEKNIDELLGIETKYAQNIHQNENFTVIAHQTLDNLAADNRKIFEQLNESLLHQIEHMEKEISFLRNQVNILTNNSAEI